MLCLTLVQLVLIGCASLSKPACAFTDETDLVRVDLKQGSIQTYKTVLEDGVSVYPFKNLPFAEPPVGKLRFKNPVPAGPWSGVRNGSLESNICPQMDVMALLAGEVAAKGHEDCLYLQVYTPRPDPSAKLPVMIWIHGGGFILGSASEYIPTHLMKKDVILVLIQYRLGTFGFMSTEDDVMPGNYGLKDQVMAFQWVQENIESFGGDRNSVTIFGQSAGGISVHFHVISPMSKGLFHRAIAQSGTALIPNFVRDDHRARAIDVGKMLECPGVEEVLFDSQLLWNCLQDIPQERLALIGNSFSRFQWNPQVMTPSVDGEFLPEHPFKMMQEGRYNKIDFMTGITKDEGAFAIRPLLPNVEAVNSLAQNFSTNGPVMMVLDPEVDSEVYSAKRMMYRYVGDTTLTEENADGAAMLYGDILFNIPLDLTAKMHARDAAYGFKTFVYELHHVGEFSFLDSPNITFGKNWVCHGDDLAYLFNSPLIPSLKEDQSLFLSELMVEMWTNFAATGNPTPDMSLGFKWDSVTPSDLPYLIIELSPYMSKLDREKRMEFMLNLPTRHNKKFFPERFVKERKL